MPFWQTHLLHVSQKKHTGLFFGKLGACTAVSTVIVTALGGVIAHISLAMSFVLFGAFIGMAAIVCIFITLPKENIQLAV